MEEHKQALLNLCRLCGGNLNRSRESYLCHTHKDNIYKAFQIDLDDDSDIIHPPRFCENCNASIARKMKALASNSPYSCSLTIVSWSNHTELDCITCEKYMTMKKGGRPKKKHTAKGRPKKKQLS